MELSDLRVALRRYWPVVAACLAFWLAIGFMIGVMPAKQYRASASLLATPTEAATSGAQTANFDIPNVVVKINSRTFRNAVEAALPARVADRSVSLVAETVEGTGKIDIKAQGADPEAIADWATAAAERAAVEAGTPTLDLEVLDTALPPSEPVSPKPVASLFATAIAGLITGVLAAVAVQRTRKALDLEGEIKRRLGVPVIGQIPAIRRLRRQAPAIDAVLTSNPAFAEAIQGLRTNVELAAVGLAPGERVIAMASWVSGEGKSTIATALGVSFAAGGRDVVLIDADLRKPTQHIKLGEPFGDGLADAGQVDPVKLLRRTRQEGLYLLPAGMPDRHPSDVLAANLPNAVHRLARGDRLVIVDAPPIHGIAETPLILSVVRQIILVVDAGSTKLPEIERAVRELRDTGVNVLGVVINRVRRRSNSSYGSYPAYTAPVLNTGPAVRATPNDLASAPVATTAATEAARLRAVEPGAAAPSSRASERGT
jgi:succinoglycan biosynthesis transport protein ExoP